MASVTLSQVRKTYPGDVEAVKTLDLDIADGEFLVLVGPSGCGKSTTLRLIAGLEDATAGEIKIGEKRVNDVAPKDRDIAMVFQNYALYPHMTVYKNMAFGLTLRKYPKAEIKQRVGEAARILGIEDLLDRKPRALSGGQRQRVAVGRAIVRQPQVFLFDEPLSNLDAALRVQMRGELSRLHDRLKTTMIYVTHDQVEAMTLGDRIAVIKDGVLQQLDTPANVYKHPANAFVAGFIGSPPMNLVEMTVTEQNGGLALNAEGLRQLNVDERHLSLLRPRLNQRVLMGIRPEDLVENRAQIATPGVTLAGEVKLVEPLGAETHVYLEAGPHKLIARLQPEAIPDLNTEHLVDIRMANAHFFDPASGATIK